MSVEPHDGAEDIAEVTHVVAQSESEQPGSLDGIRTDHLVCLLFFAIGKICGTFFLLERVHVVHGASSNLTRRASKLYQFNLLLAGVFWGTCFIAVQFWGSSAERQDGACLTHDKPVMAFVTLGVEIVLNVYLGALFVIPLYSGSFKNQRIRHVAIKSLISMSVVLVSSSANIAVFSYYQTSELSWVCLISCTIDTFVSSASLFAQLTCGEHSRTTSSDNKQSSDPTTKYIKRIKSKISHGSVSQNSVSYLFTRDIETIHTAGDESPPPPSHKTFTTLALSTSRDGEYPPHPQEVVGKVYFEDSRGKVKTFDSGVQGKEEKWKNLGKKPPGEDDPASWRGDSGKFEGNVDRDVVPSLARRDACSPSFCL
ncbi:hypothetical protein P7C70_g5297, partial [Phenoliferia sp. Uapishka_3]